MQKRLPIGHLYTQLDPFALKLTRYKNTYNLYYIPFLNFINETKWTKQIPFTHWELKLFQEKVNSARINNGR